MCVPRGFAPLSWISVDCAVLYLPKEASAVPIKLQSHNLFFSQVFSDSGPSAGRNAIGGFHREKFPRRARSIPVFWRSL